MQQAVPAGQGGMAAILGLDDSDVLAACAEAAQGDVVSAVNFNAPGQVVIAGDPGAADFRALAAVLHERAGAKWSVLAADGGEGQRWLAARAPWLANMTAVNGRVTAYVCEHYTCRAPVAGVGELRAALAAG